MKISIIGTGYVGLVTGACFAEMGNSVVCLDTDVRKVELLSSGAVPIHEPGLEELVERNVNGGRLSFTSSYDEAVTHGEIFFIAVGTPPGEDGGADLNHVLDAARSIGSRIARQCVVVNKSTVPVGTAEAVRAVLRDQIVLRGLDLHVSVASNPEFLKEGAAVEDCMRPERIIVGTDDARAAEVLRGLYAPFCRNRDKLILMDVRSAELTKYAANAMLATRISFMNEMANFAEGVGADIEAVRRGIGSDSRIGPSFLYAGVGYGGSCFPKDVKALIKTARDVGTRLGVIEAVEKANVAQKKILFSKILAHYGGPKTLGGKVVAVWGLAFKPNTDDMREAPSEMLIRQVVANGATVCAYDPVARTQAERTLSDLLRAGSVQIVDSAEAATTSADALVVITEWQEFRSPDFAKLAASLRDRVIFDGRNLYETKALESFGLVHHCIGRAADIAVPQSKPLTV